jgi:LysM repeat protein
MSKFPFLNRIIALFLFFVNGSLFGQNWTPINVTQYPFVDTQANIIQVHNKVILKPAFGKLINAGKKKVNILQLGDYQVQQGSYSSKCKSLLQSSFGYGGYGYIFANSTARITGVNNYQSFHNGKWIYAKNTEKFPELPLGLSGVTSKTYDENAQIKIILNRQNIKSDYKKLHIFCKRTNKSFDLKVITKSDSQRIDVYTFPKDSSINEIVIDLKSGESTYLFEIKKREPNQVSFELYGFSLETETDKGIIMHTIGNNGAGYSNVIRESLLRNDLNLYKPDLVLLDLGIYDFFTTDYDEAYIKRNIVSLINVLKSTVSKPGIILISGQDHLKGKYSWDILAQYSLLLSHIAKTEKVGFYDWYRISGGNKSIHNWIDTGLALDNGRELTELGYQLKGSLMFQALKHTSNRLFSKSDLENSIWVPIKDSGYLFRIDTTHKDEIHIPVTEVPIYDWVMHKVHRGETISSIAGLYDVSTLQLKYWNKLKRYAVKKGQKLKIYAKVGTEINTPIRPIKSNPILKDEAVIVIDPPKKETISEELPKKAIIKKISFATKKHKVKRSETLYSISKKYHMTVDELKSLNKIKGNNISVGQTLLVK